MFKSHSINGSHAEVLPDEQLKKLKFIIVYGKYTKDAAVHLYNIVSSQYTCVLWDEKIYLNNESQLTNKNKRIFVGGNLSRKYYELEKDIDFIQINGLIAFRVQGCMAFFYRHVADVNDFDFESDDYKKEDEKNWSKRPLLKKTGFYCTWELLTAIFDENSFCDDSTAIVSFYNAINKSVRDGYIDKFINDEFV